MVDRSEEADARRWRWLNPGSDRLDRPDSSLAYQFHLLAASGLLTDDFIERMRSGPHQKPVVDHSGDEAAKDDARARIDRAMEGDAG